MGTDHREIETKYDVDAQAVLPALDQITSVAQVEGPAQHQLVATYYDTADLALAHAGISLRRRTGGDDAGWHLKLPLPDARHEVRLPLGRAAHSVPKELRGLVRSTVRDRPLSPVVEIRSDRNLWRLLDAAGTTLAEISDDRVESVRESADGPEPSMSWREWEVELVDGPRSTLEAAGKVLRSSGGVPSATGSKLLHSLGLEVPRSLYPTPEEPHLRGPVSRLVHRWLVDQVVELRRQDPLVRHGDPRALHHMRVAVRRLSGALASYRNVLERDVTDPLRTELSWLAAELGEPRDAHVQRRRVGRLLGEQRRALRRRVDRELRDRHDHALELAVAALDSDRYLDLLDRLDELATRPPWRDRADRRARQVLPARLCRDWDRLEGRITGAFEATDPAERAARLHDARRAAKRLRYALEPVVPIYGKDARRCLAAVRQLQSALGEHQDSVVAQGLLRELPTQLELDPADAFALGLLFVRERESATDSDESASRAWRKALRRRPRRWLP